MKGLTWLVSISVAAVVDVKQSSAEFSYRLNIAIFDAKNVLNLYDSRRVEGPGATLIYLADGMCGP